MPGVGFQEQKQLRSDFKPRDYSPDSVILTHDSNLSLFSSASASVERCSFASDGHDHQTLVSEISKHLAGCDPYGCSSRPDPDLNSSMVHKNSHDIGNGENAKDQEEDDDEVDAEDDNQAPSPAINSFSRALKECQNRRLRSGALPEAKKPADRRRPVSLDLNYTASNAASSSPRFGVMKKSSVSSRRTGAFPSPGTPTYRQASGGIQKGWSSERVPLPANGNGKNVNAALLTLRNGRTLPSKWEDAEKWIFSPVAGDGVSRSSIPPHQRRPKSKSGPLGLPGIAYHSMYSPAMPMCESVAVGNFMAGSPFSTGVMLTDAISIRCGNNGGSHPAQTESCMARSASVHGCSDLTSESLLPSSQDEKLEGTKEAGTVTSRLVMRRDIATQMSPECSPHSSPKGRRPSFQSPPSLLLPVVELQTSHSSKLEVRDVQVDERVTMTRWSKKHRGQVPGKGPGDMDCKKKAVDDQAAAWEVVESSKCISKLKREEANITAWENLQTAKAEASIRKLEMKLEKKRSSSMDKIMNKLRSAQRKAQEMRSSVLEVSHSRQVAQTSQKIVSFRRHGHMGSLSGCFTCHAF